MATLQDVVNQLSVTRQAAVDSTTKNQAIIDAQANLPVPDPAVLAACQDTIDANTDTIQKCDQNIATAILQQAGVDQWLADLAGLTSQMSTLTKQLTAEINALNQAKAVASAVADVLSKIPGV
jgi:predicted component of type VI protein secretion system